MKNDEDNRGRRNLLSILWLTLGICVLIAGVIGYFNYEELVKPNLRWFVCCIPASLIAGVLFFFCIAAKLGMGSRPQITPTIPAVDYKRERSHKVLQTEPTTSTATTTTTTITTTKAEIKTERRRIIRFLKEIEEQYRSGLLLPEPYRQLKTKYERKLRELEFEESGGDEGGSGGGGGRGGRQRQQQRSSSSNNSGQA